MGWFKRKREELAEDDFLEELVLTDFPEENVKINPEPMSVENLEQKKQLVENCCDRIASANSRMKELKVEYQTVNSYLTDIKLIEDLPDTDADKLLASAKKVVVLDKDRRDFGRSMSKLTDFQYSHMREYEDDISDILKEMSEDEKYCETVKTDMKYLEGEKAGLKYEIKVFNDRLYLLNGISKLGIIAFIVLMIVFLVINYYYGKDTSLLIYGLIVITVIFAAVIFAVHTQTIAELRVTENKLNRAIGLLNKVKLKYVNVVSRLAYSYEKHGVKSAYQLNKIWGNYLTLKKEHEVYNRASIRLVEAEDELEAVLKRAGVRDTGVWISQAYAIVNPKDMYDIKTNLMNRRGKLKSSLDYNADTIEKAKDEIKEVILSDEENATQLMGILDAYEV
jgi:hypothetical protein